MRLRWATRALGISPGRSAVVIEGDGPGKLTCCIRPIQRCEGRGKRSWRSDKLGELNSLSTRRPFCGSRSKCQDDPRIQGGIVMIRDRHRGVKSITMESSHKACYKQRALEAEALDLPNYSAENGVIHIKVVCEKAGKDKR